MKTLGGKILNSRIFKGVTSGLQAVGGGVQVWAGGALCSTGLGAIIGAPLIAHGLADIHQGGMNLVNTIADNGKETPNFMQSGYKTVGRAIGGEKGEKIASGIFNVVDVALGFVSIGGALKHVKQVKKIDKLGDVFKYVAKSAKSGIASKFSSAVKNVKNIPNVVKSIPGVIKGIPKQIASFGGKSYNKTVAVLGNNSGHTTVETLLPFLKKVDKVEDVAVDVKKVTVVATPKPVLMLPAPGQSSFDIGERLVSKNVYEQYIKGQDTFRLGAPNANSFFFNKSGSNQATRSFEAAVNAGFTPQNISDTIKWGDNELVRIKFKLDKVDDIVVPGVSKIPGGIGDGVIPGTNDLFTGKGWTKNYLGEKGIDEFIGTNVRFTSDDILEVKNLGKIRK